MWGRISSDMMTKEAVKRTQRLSTLQRCRTQMASTAIYHERTSSLTCSLCRGRASTQARMVWMLMNLSTYGSTRQTMIPPRRLTTPSKSMDTRAEDPSLAHSAHWRRPRQTQTRTMTILESGAHASEDLGSSTLWAKVSVRPDLWFFRKVPFWSFWFSCSPTCVLNARGFDGF